MKSRLILTLIWLSSLVLCIAALESYVHVRTSEGTRYLIEEDRADTMKPIAVLYAAYLVGILGAWFVRPWKNPRSGKAERQRFAIAVGCTVLFNALILFFVLQAYLLPGERHDVAGSVTAAVTLAGWLSFIVAPVNLFYFGVSLGTGHVEKGH
jgi:predicted transporter